MNIIKSILTARSQNGLKCGTDSNFDEDQLKFILEEGLNKFSATKFKVLDDGSIQVTPFGANDLPDAQDLSDQLQKDFNDPGVYMGPDIGTVDDSKKAEQVKQKSVKSGIIVKNCLKDLTTDELSKTRQWIAEYERRYNG